MSLDTLLARPLSWPVVTRDELSHRNVLCRHREPWRATWLEHEWRFALQPAGALPPAVRYLHVEWGGARVILGLDESVVQAISDVALPGHSVLQWPQDVAMAAIEFSAELLSVAVETASRKSLHCVGWRTARPDEAGFERYAWSASNDQRRLEGEIWLDAVACRYLAAQLREHPTGSDDSRLGDWDALPLVLRLSVGWVDLPASTLPQIELRDVLMLDECLLSHGGQQLLLHLGAQLGLSCEIEGQSLRVLEGVQEIMSDATVSLAGAAGVLDDIPVRLSFDVGEREISLGDLRSIQPGYVFNLGRDPRGLVSIRANGRLIGEGELVDIEGRLGVSVLRFKLESS
jgi:type III secretion protein Q